MRRVTNLMLLAAFLFTGSAFAQSTDYSFVVERSDDPQSAYPPLHSGVRTVSGPYDLDGDGLQEVLVSDYTGGSRVHVLEVTGPDTWEHVYSTPWLDDYSGTNNGRAIAAGDMDGDGKGEIYFFGGASYAEDSPYPYGLYAFEFTGTDNDYGTEPATVYEMPDAPDRWRQEQIVISDVDGDGDEEMMFGNNGASGVHDNWWIISVDGDIGSGFETWANELVLASRVQDFDPVNRGGGSPYGAVPADLDGNGINELVFGSWNNFNITLGQATSADTYFLPSDPAGSHWAHLSPTGDTVMLFGLDVIDINQDGDDEVFGAEYNTGQVYVINYEAGENVFAITEDNYAVALPSFSTLGLTAGDLDQDGNIDLIGTGTAYSASQFNNDDSPNWVNIVEFTGTNPEDPSHYGEVTNVFFPNDKTDAFDYIIQDSAGVITEFRQEPDGGPQFASKFAFLGDVDDDGYNEVALGFQGQVDSLYTRHRFFNPADSSYVLDPTVPDVARVNDQRVFMRILSAGATGISIQDERVVIPNDYVLEQNYPNPFNPTTNIRFELPRDKAVSLTIFDVSGRVVKTLVDNQYLPQGTHEIQWDGTSNAGGQVASGTYLYQLKFGNFAHTKTMVLLK